MASMLSVCTLSDWEEIVCQAVVAAKQGDHKSREWLACHVLGPSGSKAITFTSLDKRAQEDRYDLF